MNGLDNFQVGFLDTFPTVGSAIDPNSYIVCGSVTIGVTTGLVLDVTCSVSGIFRYVIVQSVDTHAEKLCLAEVCVQEGGLCVHLYTGHRGYGLHLRQKLLLLCFALPTSLNSIITCWCAVKKLLTVLITNSVQHQVQAFSSRAG